MLLVSIAQRLVRRICSNCREEYNPPQAALDFFGLGQDKSQKFYRGRGCYYCLESGYRGRTGIYEVLVVDDEVEEMIIRKASAREITRTMSASGKLTTLKEAAGEKVRQGVTTAEEAASAVMA